MSIKTPLPLAAAILLFGLSAHATRGESLVIAGGTIETLAGDPIVGDVVIEDGVITAIGPDVTAPAGAERIDASGLYVYPGLFDAMSQLGLIEIGSIAATVDSTEIGKFNPHLRAATAVHPASEVIPVTRANGITHAVIAPTASGGGGSLGNDDAGIIPGQAALLHLDGWTVEEMTLEPDVGMVIAWPAIRTRTFDFATFSTKSAPYSEASKKAEEARDELRDWLDAARHYAKAIDAPEGRTAVDLRLEALVPMLEGRQPAMMVANNKADIESAVAFAEEQGIEMVLAGGKEAWRCAELLAEKKIPVILGLTQDTPDNEDSPYDEVYQTAGKLVQAGVKVAFGSGAGGGDGPGGPHTARTLPYEAAMAAAYGMSREDALLAITRYPAEILGVADRVGTIETGKLANLIVTTGNPLEITTQIEHLIIRGHQVSTDNRHKQLYEKYRSRPQDTQ